MKKYVLLTLLLPVLALLLIGCSNTTEKDNVKEQEDTTINKPIEEQRAEELEEFEFKLDEFEVSWDAHMACLNLVDNDFDEWFRTSLECIFEECGFLEYDDDGLEITQTDEELDLCADNCAILLIQEGERITKIAKVQSCLNKI